METGTCTPLIYKITKIKIAKYNMFFIKYQVIEVKVFCNCECFKLKVTKDWQWMGVYVGLLAMQIQGAFTCYMSLFQGGFFFSDKI